MKEIFVLPTQLNKRLISTIVSYNSTNPPKNSNFSLKSTSDFASRSGDVFGKLNSLEKNHEVWMSKNSMFTSFEDKEHPDSVKSELEVFKKPLQTKLWKSKRSAFTFKRRPAKKWRKYSLEDVPITSEANNAAIALQFISELRARKESTCITHTKKIIFSKPKQSEKKTCNLVSSACHGEEIVSASHRQETVSALKATVLKRKKEEKSPKVGLPHLQDDGCDNN